MKKFLAWVIAFLFAITSYSQVSYAHANLIAMSPTKGDVVDTSPDQVTLDFSEPLEPDLIDLKIYNSNGQRIETPSPKVEPGKAYEMYTVLPKLNEGTYTVVWSVVSEDGHPVSDSYYFSVGSFSVPGKVSFSTFNISTTLLIIVRYLVEGIFLLYTGVYGFAWFASQRKFPDFQSLFSKRIRRLLFLILFMGTIVEWLIYSSTLPGGGFNKALLEGKLNLITQSPFAEMLIVQFVWLLLLVLPGMVEGWYLLLWFAVPFLLSYGGHALSVEYTWIDLSIRAIHLLSISFWLGALTYLIQFVRYEKRIHQKIVWGEFRSFFVLFVFLSSALVIFTGIDLVALQTDWITILTDMKTWGILLSVKIGLLVLMLLIALRQTILWRRSGRFSSFKLLRVEWFAGILAVLAGVWMSQSAYPQPIKSYDKSFISNEKQLSVHISQLTIGNQPIDFQIRGPMGSKPVNTQVKLEHVQMKMPAIILNPKAKADRSYETVLPLTMSGKWQYTIDFDFADGSRSEWSDILLIPQGGQ